MMNKRGNIDPVLAGSVLLLIMLGLVMVFSASSMFAKEQFGSLTHFFSKQLIWAIGSVTIMVIFSKLDYKLISSDKIPIMLIATTIVLLVGLIFFGRVIKGAVRWYSLGFMNFQPSEVAKIAIIFFLAHKLSRKGIEKLDFKSFLMPIYLVVGTILLLIVRQPDLSTSIMIAGITFLMLFVSRVRQRYLLYTSFSIIPFIIFVMSRDGYQALRIKKWLASLSDPMLAAHQVKQSIIGIGRGGVFGNGMGESKQKLFFLPDSHTDFIFSIIGEEWGFVGTTIILTLFIIILVRGLRIARNAPTPLVQFLALGITLNITLYAMTNAAVVTNLFPATGLPMPFVSYGGSHMIFMGMSMGLLLNISRMIDKKGAAHAPGTFQNSTGRTAVTAFEIE